MLTDVLGTRAWEAHPQQLRCRRVDGHPFAVPAGRPPLLGTKHLGLTNSQPGQTTASTSALPWTCPRGLCWQLIVYVRVCALNCFSRVQPFVTLWTESPPGSSVHGILQVRILEWVAIPSFRGSSRPRDRPHFSYVSWISRQILYH